MAKKNNQAHPLHTCGECAHGKPWSGPPDNPWNTSLEGVPITLHCHLDPDHIRRGIFRSDTACKSFKHKQTSCSASANCKETGE